MAHGPRLVLLGLVFPALTLIIGGCPWSADSLSGVVDVAVGVQARRLTATQEVPGSVVVAPDGRVFYTERSTGKIRVIKDGVLLDTPVAEVPVNSANDRGALGLALHPSFAVNNRLYLFYSRSSTGQTTNGDRDVADQRVVYFVLNGDTAADGEVFVASMPATGVGKRVGGRIAFGADASLYVALGDQGDDAAAKDPNNLSGKVLRYTQDGGIPASNPTADSPVFASGFRHPQGLAVDPESGGVFLVDRNDGGLHEINRVLPGSFYGWPDVQGFLSDADKDAYLAANPTYVDPLLDAGVHATAFVGAAFNPLGKYGASLIGRLIYGISSDGQLYAATLSAERDAVSSADLFAAGFPNDIVDVACSGAGVLYVATTANIYILDTFPY